MEPKTPLNFAMDQKLQFYQTRRAKRYKESLHLSVDKLIKDEAIEIDGEKHSGITDILSHSLGSAVGQQITIDHG